MWQHWQRIIKEEAEKYGYGKEQEVRESATKAALEDFMYDLPKAAVAELQPVMKGTLRGGPLRDKVSSILKKHKVPTFFMGTSATQVVLDNFDTFFGESVEEQTSKDIQMKTRVKKQNSATEEAEKINEDHECGCNVDKSAKKIQSRIKSYKQATAQKIGEQVVRPTLKEVQRHMDSQMQPHAEARIGNTQEVFGVTDIEITEDGMVKSFKWNDEIVTEAKVKYLTGPGKRDSRRIIGIYTMQGKWIKDMNSEKEAANFVNKSWGESVEEEVELDEASWGGGFQSSSDAQREVQAGLKRDFQRERAKTLSLMVQVIRGEISKQKFKKLTGSNFDDLMKTATYYINQIKRMPKKALTSVAKVKTEEVIEDGEVEEAYAHPDEKVIGSFYEKSHNQGFEYRISKSAWGKSHGLPHEVCVSRKDYKSGGDWRAANVKGTVCYIAVDEGEGGKPVIEKWDIKKHVKYVKAEGVEHPVWKSIVEGAAEDAQRVAKGIVAKAKELGVQINVTGSTSVSFTKSFTAGSEGEFSKAYSDCNQVRNMVTFKNRQNQWGASGLGRQSDIKNGRVTIHKSGDGAAYLLKAIDKMT